MLSIKEWTIPFVVGENGPTTPKSSIFWPEHLLLHVSTMWAQNPFTEFLKIYILFLFAKKILYSRYFSLGRLRPSNLGPIIEHDFKSAQGQPRVSTKKLACLKSACRRPSSIPIPNENDFLSLFSNQNHA